MENTEDKVPECRPIPMAEWVEQPDPNNCRPCLLGPVVGWYRDHLEEKGQAEIARKIEQLASADVLTICKELDNIKESVDPETRGRLEVFDCAVQDYTNTPSEQIKTTPKEVTWVK